MLVNLEDVKKIAIGSLFLGGGGGGDIREGLSTARRALELGEVQIIPLSEVGESEIAYCESCTMAATTERAECVDAPAQTDVELLPMEEVHTPGTKTIEEVANFLGLDQTQTIKALLFVTYDEKGEENGYVAAFVRGDRELNMIKLVNALKIPEHAIAFADEEKMADDLYMLRCGSGGPVSCGNTGDHPAG